MVRAILKSEKSDLTIKLPEDMVGKLIEVIAFEVEETAAKIPSKTKPSQLRGFLSAESAKSLQKHIKQSRDEWHTL